MARGFLGSRFLRIRRAHSLGAIVSASEKLKALEPRIERLPGGIAENLDSYEAKKELADALPQIVAVVEAAESLDAEMKRYADGEEPDAEQYAYRQLALWKSLAALDEALG